LVALVVAAVTLLGVSSATALTRYQTEITVDSSVPVGGGFFLDSGQVFQKARCDRLDRAVRLIGIRADGTKKLLDFTLPSIPGEAWATKSKRTGFQRVVAKIRRSHRHGRPGHRWICTGASIKVFPG